jgi:hypothetical protein
VDDQVNGLYYDVRTVSHVSPPISSPPRRHINPPTSTSPIQKGTAANQHPPLAHPPSHTPLYSPNTRTQRTHPAYARNAPRYTEHNHTTPIPPHSESDDSISTCFFNEVRTQTHLIHTTPDDPNAVVDSGAMLTTVPRRLLLGTPWEENIRPTPPGTTIRYGNMETEPVEEHAHIGEYNASLVPDRFSTALICVHDIVIAGHTVAFTNLHTIISDTGSAYTVTIPRLPSSREWRVPIHLLQRLTDLRIEHPLRHVRPHPTDSGPN